MTQDKLSYRNPFDVLTNDTKEAEDFSKRADLLLTIRDLIENSELSEASVCSILGITPSQSRDILAGKFRKFSVNALLGYIETLRLERPESR